MHKKSGMKCKVCRRLATSVCGKVNCAFRKRQSPPGVHGPTHAAGRRKVTEYGRQLVEKQKAKALYGLFEKQFRAYVEKASVLRGNTSVKLCILLESRLDNTVFRLGFAPTRRAARQMVSHGAIKVDGKRLNIPSYQVRIGQVISLTIKQKQDILKDAVVKRLGVTKTPSWLTIDASAFSGKVTSIASENDFDRSFNAGQIIEFYSR